jgi:hypothetical protein
VRQDVTFSSQGSNGAGRLYAPFDLGNGEKHTALVMAHGLGVVKEMYSSNLAEKFDELPRERSATAWRARGPLPTR